MGVLKQCFYGFDKRDGEKSEKCNRGGNINQENLRVSKAHTPEFSSDSSYGRPLVSCRSSA